MNGEIWIDCLIILGIIVGTFMVWGILANVGWWLMKAIARAIWLSRL